MLKTNSHNHQSKMFVISAPSGAGKSSLINALILKHPELRLAISHTTRKKRCNETDALEYYFINNDTFLRMLKNNEFIEHAKVYDNYYGTSKTMLCQLMQSGRDVVLEIDWQGAFQVKKIFPQAILIFIIPPNIETLKQRLLQRATDSLEVINKRLEGAKLELSKQQYFDHVVVNDDFTSTLMQLCSIMELSNQHSFGLKSPH